MNTEGPPESVWRSWLAEWTALPGDSRPLLLQYMTGRAARWGRTALPSQVGLALTGIGGAAVRAAESLVHAAQSAWAVQAQLEAFQEVARRSETHAVQAGNDLAEALASLEMAERACSRRGRRIVEMMAEAKALRGERDAARLALSGEVDRHVETERELERVRGELVAALRELRAGGLLSERDSILLDEIKSDS